VKLFLVIFHVCYVFEPADCIEVRATIPQFRTDVTHEWCRVHAEYKARELATHFTQGPPTLLGPQPVTCEEL
jgi:hypothetical protein